MNMTERDWEIVLAEHRESFHVMADAVTPANKQPVTQTPIERKGSPDQIFKYIRIEKTTAKAKFFVTHDDLAETHGFWCPNAAIVSTRGDEVHIEKWCKLRTVQFT